MSHTFFLIRHGEAESGILGSYPERQHVRRLTECGREQIRKAATELSDAGIAAILASPLERTKESAEILGRALDLPVTTDIRLRETGFGRFNGLPIEEFFAHYPTPESRIVTNGSDGVESFESVEARLRSLLADIRKHFPEGALALVSHSDTLSVLHGILSEASLEESISGWAPAEGEWRRIEFVDRG